MNNKKIIIISSIAALALITTSAIALPLIFNNKNDFKDDGHIEIWTTSSEKDQFFNSFKTNFVDEFNKNSEYKVELVTITPQESLASDIAIKMEAKSEVPNLFIGKGQDSIYLSKFENDFVQLSNMDDYTDSVVLDNYSYYFDDYQEKNIKPYAPLMINGEVLYINELQMQSFISFVLDNSLLEVDNEFQNLFDYSESETYNNYFDIELISSNATLDNFKLKYSNTLSVDLFESWEGVIDLSMLIKSLFSDDSIYSFGIDRDVSAAMYLTFNAVGNSYDDWMFNNENDLNFIESTISQNAYSNFVDSYQYLIDEGVMWVRENDNTNPTGPFVNDELTMFVGANFNSKYLNSEDENKIQYDESVITMAPNRLMNDSDDKFVYTKPKTINGLKFGTNEDEVTGNFIDFTLSKLNSDYDFFINEGYLPPISTKENFLEFANFINDDSNFVGSNEKTISLIKSLRMTTASIIESFDDPNMVIFDVPQLETTTLFEELLFESNRMNNGEEAVEYLINQLEVNA